MQRENKARKLACAVLQSFQNLFWGLFALIVFAMPMAEAKSKAKVVPCNGAFEMKLQVTPVDALGENTPVGLKLEIKKDAFRGIASHIHNKDSGEFGKAKCEAWQKNTWPMLAQIRREQTRPGREHMACRNVASLEYKVSGKSNKELFCLGDARSDGLTFMFRRFYDGTENLLGI